MHKVSSLKVIFNHQGFYFIFTLSFVIVSEFLLQAPFMGFIASVSGICYVFLAGNRRAICHIFGIIYCISYALTAYEAKLFGEIALTSLYLFINLLGILEWNKHKNPENKKIELRKMDQKTWLYAAMGIFMLTIIHLIFFLRVQTSYLFLNSLTFSLQITAYFLQSQRYSHHYLIVTLANILMLFIWGSYMLEDKQYFLQFFNTLIFLFIGIFYHLKWIQQLKSQYLRTIN